MTKSGKALFTLLLLLAVGIGVWRWWDVLNPNAAPATPAASHGTAPASSDPADPVTPSGQAAAAELLAEPMDEPGLLGPPGTFQPVDNVIAIELSEYAGYAGLIAANGGLAPSDTSYFAKKHGFKVKLTLSEEESWPALNAGTLAASATTVDVLAVYGRQFHVVVPAQIGFSRGADGIVVRAEIRRFNDLKGKVLTTAQFTEADFFLRYLAQEAGLPVRILSGPQDRPDPNALNLLCCTDAFAAGDYFLDALRKGTQSIAGCVTWAPKTTEVVEQSGGRARILTTNRNLLVVADILVANRGFAEAHPKIVAGLVDGLLEGNRLVRDQRAAYLDTVASAFGWSPDETAAELDKVHLSNLPENLAFFSGRMDAAGSFHGIYQSAVVAYGTSILKNPVDGDRFLALDSLKALESAGAYPNQKIEIAPIRSEGAGPLEQDPLLSRDVRFYFQPNSAELDAAQPDNQQQLSAVEQLLRVSPGSTVLLRGHVDNGMVEQFRKDGGESFVRQMALRAMELSKNRAAEIKRLLVEQKNIAPDRIDTVGRGWEEPIPNGSNDENRRVEVQWFTIE